MKMGKAINQRTRYTFQLVSSEKKYGTGTCLMKPWPSSSWAEERSLLYKRLVGVTITPVGHHKNKFIFYSS